MKRIIIFGEALTYPPKEGITAHVFSLLEFLSSTDHVPILVMSDRGFFDQTLIQTFPWQTVLVPPEQFYSLMDMQPLIESLNPDILQSYNVYQARLIGMPLADSLNIPFVFEHHDLEDSLSTFLGLPKELADDNKRFQKDIFEFASLNRVMSETDYHKVLPSLSLEARNRTIHIPVGVKAENKPLRLKIPRDVLFLGNCAYPPNEKALRMIISEIAPRNLDRTFHLVGRMTDVICAESETTENVHAYGQVDILGPIAAKCFAGIVPIVAGSGMKVKVMTYMSLGLPVVGSELAFEGYSQADYLRTANDYEDYSTIFNEFTQTHLFSRLSAHAYNDFMKLYEVHNASKRLSEEYDKLPSTIPSHVRILPHAIKRDDKRLAWIHESRETTFTSVTTPFIGEPR